MLGTRPEIIKMAPVIRECGSRSLITESEKVSVIIVTYNHKKYIEACISSIEQESYPHEIIVVDSLSQDGTCDLVRKKYPHIHVIECQENLGYGCCNNLGVQYAKGDYVVVLNPDTIVKKGWLKELMKPLVANPNIITTPKILTYDGSAINTCGNINHFTGLTFTRGLGEDPDAYSKQEYVSGFSGCCFAMRKDDYLRLGGFDENFFLYNEDSDLSWRSHLTNLKILFVPTSVIMHDYELNVSPEKLYHLEKSRYLKLRKYISLRDFICFLPSLAAAEVLTFGYSARLGLRGMRFKIKALRDGLTVKVDSESKGKNKSRLYKELSSTIPVDQLTFSFADRIAKVLANYIFVWNLGLAR